MEQKTEASRDGGTPFTLADLEAIVQRRAAADASSSYTAGLVHRGIGRAARKFGEEAVEMVVAALSEDEASVRDEAADLLFHLAVVLHMRGVAVAEVMGELSRRTAQSGLEEKASRSPDAGR